MTRRTRMTMMMTTMIWVSEYSELIELIPPHYKYCVSVVMLFRSYAGIDVLREVTLYALFKFCLQLVHVFYHLAVVLCCVQYGIEDALSMIWLYPTTSQKWKASYSRIINISLQSLLFNPKVLSGLVLPSDLIFCPNLDEMVYGFLFVFFSLISQ